VVGVSLAVMALLAALLFAGIRSGQRRRQLDGEEAFG
jgi:CII-binding regulator of phage lambda lysogenization HflD